MVGVCSVACFGPISGYRRKDGTVAFAEFPGTVSVEVPCGRCVGCRLERSRQWAIRCVHEAKMHDENAFVTLTYDDSNLPPGSSLRYRDFQLFMKRLRKEFSGKLIRFYMCGEYGEQTMRPHYHVLLFGIQFPDCKKFSTETFTSEILSRLWPYGHALTGNVTYQSASYVARYCMKKVTGQAAVEYYKSVNLETGEIFDRVPEFNKMSLKPGIGMPWLSKYLLDVYPKGTVVVNGKRVKPPKFYDKKMKKLDDYVYDEIVSSRLHEAYKRADDNTLDRLEVRMKVAQARLSLYKRDLE